MELGGKDSRDGRNIFRGEKQMGRVRGRKKLIDKKRSSFQSKANIRFDLPEGIRKFTDKK